MPKADYAYAEAVKDSLGAISRSFDAKLFAHRKAIEAMMMAIDQIARQDVSAELARALRTQQASAAMLADDDDEFRHHVADELGALAEMLEDRDS